MSRVVEVRGSGALGAGRRVGYLAVSSSAAGARRCVTCPVNSSAPASDLLAELIERILRQPFPAPTLVQRDLIEAA